MLKSTGRSRTVFSEIIDYVNLRHVEQETLGRVQIRNEVLLRLLCKVEPISNVCEFLPTNWPASERVPLRTSNICHVPLLETVQPTACLEDLDGHTCIFVLGISFEQPPSSNTGGTVAGGANDCSQPYETKFCRLVLKL